MNQWENLLRIFFEHYLEKNLINPSNPETKPAWINKEENDKTVHGLYINDDLKATVEIETLGDDIVEFTFSLLE